MPTEGRAVAVEPLLGFADTCRRRRANASRIRRATLHC